MVGVSTPRYSWSFCTKGIPREGFVLSSGWLVSYSGSVGVACINSFTLYFKSKEQLYVSHHPTNQKACHTTQPHHASATSGHIGSIGYVTLKKKNLPFFYFSFFAAFLGLTCSAYTWWPLISATYNKPVNEAAVSRERDELRARIKERQEELKRERIQENERL